MPSEVVSYLEEAEHQADHLLGLSKAIEVRPKNGHGGSACKV